MHTRGLTFILTQISAGVCVTELYTLEGDFIQVLCMLPLLDVCLCACVPGFRVHSLDCDRNAVCVCV